MTFLLTLFKKPSFCSVKSGVKHILKKLFRTQNIPIFIVLFLIITFFFVKTILITQDGVWYLTTADSIFQGKGYVDIEGERVLNKPPLFQFILTLFFKTFGKSVFSAMLVLRLFWALTLLLFFLIAKKIFNQVIALGAWIIAFTYPMIYCFSSVVLKDYSLALFILLLLFLGITAIEKPVGYFLYALMGLVAGISILFKENMLFLVVPFPLIVLLLEKAGTKRKRIKLLWYFLVLCITISPWLLYIGIVNKGNLSPFLGLAFSMKGYYFNLNEFLHEFSGNFLPALQKNLYTFINLLFAFSIWGFLAWIYFLYRTFKKKDKKNLLLVVVFILYLPLMLFLLDTVLAWEGILALRLLLVFSFITILIFTAVIHDLLKLLWSRTSPGLKIDTSPLSKKSNFFFNFMFLGIIFVLSVQSLFLTSFDPRLNLISNSYLTPPNDFKIKNLNIIGFLNEKNQKITKELAFYIPENSKIMSSPYYAQSFKFLSKDKYSFAILPGYYLANNLPGSWYRPTDLINKKPISLNKNERILFVWALFPRQAFLQYLTEEKFFDALKKNSIEYIVISQELGFFSLYFEKNSSFTKVASLKDGFTKIFKVESLKPVKEFSPLFEKNARELILKAHEGKIYNGDEIFRHFKEKFNWNKDYVYSLINY